MTKATQEVWNTRQNLGLLTEEDVADTLRVTVDTLATWRTKKIGPRSIKLGKQVFYIIGDFAQWVQGQATAQFQASELAHVAERASQGERQNTIVDEMIRGAGGTKGTA